MTQTMDMLPGTRGYKTHMRKQSKRSIAGKKRWAALPAEQKQVILDRLKRHREARKKV
jgi:TRAP-type C4-dicarboxylate transport system substrate-binding protein